MNTELTEKLLKKYPKIFKEYKLPPTQTAMCWLFEHGDGWYWLLDMLCLAITEHIRDNVGVEQVVATQVKEKFGGLRFYYNGGDDYTQGAIWFAEKLSYRICEVCGSVDNVTVNEFGWISTLCDKCRKPEIIPIPANPL